MFMLFYFVFFIYYFVCLIGRLKHIACHSISYYNITHHSICALYTLYQYIWRSIKTSALSIRSSKLPASEFACLSYSTPLRDRLGLASQAWLCIGLALHRAGSAGVEGKSLFRAGSAGLEGKSLFHRIG